jgi:hypothetical protein
VSLAFYKININEGNFGQRAARQEAELGEFFYEMIEPKLPGSLEGNLELVEQKKAFQQPGTARKQFWKKQVLLHNMGGRLFDEDDYLSFFIQLKNKDKNRVIRDTQDPVIRDYLKSKETNGFNSQFATLESRVNTQYQAMFVDSGMDHGYYGQPYQYAVRSIEQALRSGTMTDAPLSLILGLGDTVSESAASLSQDDFLSHFQSLSGNVELSDAQALTVVRYLAAIHHGYVQSRYSFEANFSEIRNLDSSYVESEKQAIASVSWEMATSPVDNSIEYQHIKHNGHLYQLSYKRRIGTVTEAVFQHSGQFDADAKGDVYAAFVYSNNGTWYTQDEAGQRTEFTPPITTNSLVPSMNKISFDRIRLTSNSQPYKHSVLLQQAAVCLHRLSQSSGHAMAAASPSIRNALLALASATNNRTIISALEVLYAEVQQLLPGNGVAVSDTNTPSVKLWGCLYPILALGRVFAHTRSYIQVDRIHSAYRTQVVSLLEQKGVIAPIRGNGGRWLLLKELVQSDLQGQSGDYRGYFNAIQDALSIRDVHDIFSDQTALFEHNGGHVVGLANVQPVYGNPQLLAQYRQEQANLDKSKTRDALLMTIQNRQISARQARKAANYSQAYESWRSDVEARQLQDRRNNA